MRVNSAVQVGRRLGGLAWFVTVGTVLLAVTFLILFQHPWFEEGETEFMFFLAIGLLLIVVCCLYLDRWQLGELALDLEEPEFDRWQLLEELMLNQYEPLMRFEVGDYVMPVAGEQEPSRLCEVVATTIEAMRTDCGVRAEQRIKAHRLFSESFDVFEPEGDFRHATEEEIRFWEGDCERTREVMSRPPEEWGQSQVA